MAPHSSTLAWKIPWTEEPGGLQSRGSWAVGHDWATSLSLHFHALEKEMATHSSVLAWRIPGTGEPGGLPSMGSHRVRQGWSNSAAAAAAAQETLHTSYLCQLPCYSMSPGSIPLLNFLSLPAMLLISSPLSLSCKPTFIYLFKTWKK